MTWAGWGRASTWAKPSPRSAGPPPLSTSRLHPGGNARGGWAQVVSLDKSITLQGGSAAAFSEPPDPQANPTTLDAGGQGRGGAVFGPAGGGREGGRGGKGG